MKSSPAGISSIGSGEHNRNPGEPVMFADGPGHCPRVTVSGEILLTGCM
jgi:hypothetical protein